MCSGLFAFVGADFHKKKSEQTNKKHISIKMCSRAWTQCFHGADAIRQACFNGCNDPTRECWNECVRRAEYAFDCCDETDDACRRGLPPPACAFGRVQAKKYAQLADQSKPYAQYSHTCPVCHRAM